MFPIRDAVPSPSRPIATRTLVAIFAALTVVLGVLRLVRPGIFPTAGVFGAGGEHGAAASLWALLSMVRPSGWFQAVACAIALWIFGPTVEDRLGRDRFLALYAGCAAAAGAAVAALGGLPLSAVVLLPGAIGGVLGAHTALYPRARILVVIPAAHGIDVGDVSAGLVAGLWVTAQLASGLGYGASVAACSPGLALVQAASGFVSGAAAASVLKRPERMRVEWWSP